MFMIIIINILNYCIPNIGQEFAKVIVGYDRFRSFGTRYTGMKSRR